ncbi:MAG: nuclear transport factor 2 family protein [Lachnospiraceae bacterium]|nr:nuclear transport factor 2 family protein [Lachnospiraceae bacterium]
MNRNQKAILVASLLSLSMAMSACGGGQSTQPAKASTSAVEETAKETESSAAASTANSKETESTGNESTTENKESESTGTESTATESSEQAAGTVVDENSEDYVIELDPQYNVPTEELLKKFPIKHQTPAATDLSKKIQNRMLNGFNRWNMGYDAWEHWGEVLYHDDSIYNVNGVRLTLKEYQQAMDVSLKKLDIRMGDFKNMVLVDDWMAIQYETVNIDRETGAEKPGTTMEFAKFGDYDELGAKVDEGWGGVKNDTYSGTMHFQTEEEQKAQQEFMDELIATELKDTDNLEDKYPIVYPTTIDTELGEKMKAAILEDFDKFNQGYGAWDTWTKDFYTDDVAMNYLGEDISLDDYKAEMKKQIGNTQKVRINNILVSEDWAAIHYWTVTEKEDGTKDADNHMQFLHFVENGDGIQVDICYAK